MVTQAEEKTTREFYRKFKNRGASSGVDALAITPDWEQPDTKEGKASGMQEVADEAAKYYKWLFASKDSTRSERLLSLLRKKQLSKRTRNAIDGKISMHEVRDAIFASITRTPHENMARVDR